MNIGVSTYSYWGLTEKGASAADILRQAKRDGFGVVEIAEGLMPETGRLDAARALREEARTLGLRLACYSVGGNLLCEDQEAETRRLMGEADVAAALGVRRFRFDCAYDYTGEFSSFEKIVALLAPCIRKIAEHGERAGVLCMMENHGRLFLESRRLEQLFDAVDHPNFQLLADIGNVVDADEDPIVALGRLARRVRHVHVKDFHLKNGNEPDPGPEFYRSRGMNYLRGAIVGHGNVPVYQCLKLLCAAQYQGDAVIEFEGIEPCEMAVPLCKRNLERFLQMARIDVGES